MAIIARFMSGIAICITIFGLCGCASTPIDVSQDDSDIVVKSSGVTIYGKIVKPHEVAKMLKDREIPKTRTIHVLVDDSALNDLSEARMVLNYLRAAGYTRNALVTKKRGSSSSSQSGNTRWTRRNSQ